MLCKLLSRAEHVMVGACSRSRRVLTAVAVAALLMFQLHICCWAAARLLLLLLVELGLGDGGDRHAWRQRSEWVRQ